MKKRTIIIVLLVSLVALIGITFLTMEYTRQRKVQAAYEGELVSGRIVQVGYVTAVEGHAHIRGRKGALRPLQVDDPISINETLVTGEGSRLLVRLHDESELRLGASSEMLIESFLYDPVDASRNRCSLQMMKGAFRVLTRGITEMNPERFQVKTRMATIGIRGCEVGFMLSAAAESVFILAVSDAVEVSADKKNAVVKTQKGKKNAVTIRNPGFVVRIRPDGTLSEEVTDPNEEAILIIKTSIADRIDAASDKARLSLLLFADGNEGDAGDPFLFNARILHLPDSGGQATNVIVRSLLSPYTRFEGLPVSISGTIPDVSTNIVPIVTTNSEVVVTSMVQVIDFTTDTFGLTNTPIQFSYPMQLTDSVYPHQILTNVVYLLWNNKDEVIDGRVPVYTNKHTLLTTIDHPRLIADRISDTTVSESNLQVYDPTIEDVVINEEVTYYVTAVLSEGTMPIHFTKSFPVLAGIDPLDIVSARWLGSGGSIQHHKNPPLITILDTDDDNIRDQVTFDFGTTINHGNNITGPDDQIQLAITARVTDSDVNQPRARWIGEVEMEYGGLLTLLAEVPVEIIRGELELEDEVVPARFESDREPGVEEVPPREPVEEENVTPEQQDNDGNIEILFETPDNDRPGIIVDPPQPPEPPPSVDPDPPRRRRPPELPDLPDLPDIVDPGTTPSGP